MAEKGSTSRLHANDPDFEICINYLKTSTIHVTNPWHFLDPLRCYTLLYNAGIEKYRAKQYELALVFFNFCQRINKKCKSYLFSILIYSRKDEAKKALDLIHQCEGDGDNPHYYVIRAILLHHFFELRKAVLDCDKAIKLSRRKSALAYLVKGDTLKLLPVDPCLPSKYYRKALKLEPHCGPYIGKGFQGDDEHFNWLDHFETLIFKFHPLSERPDYLNYDQIMNDPNVVSQFVLHEDNPFYKVLRGEVGFDPSTMVHPGLPKKRKRRKRLKLSKLAGLIPSLMNDEDNASSNSGKSILDIEPLREYRQYWNEPSAFSRAKAREAHAKMRRDQAIMFSNYKASPPEYDKPWRVNALLSYDKRIKSEHDSKDFRYYPLLSSSMAGKKHFREHQSSSKKDIKKYLQRKQASKKAKRDKWRLLQKKKKQKLKKKSKTIEEKMQAHQMLFHPIVEVKEEPPQPKDTYFMKHIGMFSPILNNFFEGDATPRLMEPNEKPQLAPVDVLTPPIRASPSVEASSSLSSTSSTKKKKKKGSSSRSKGSLKFFRSKKNRVASLGVTI